jgi:hypothetical protein
VEYLSVLLFVQLCGLLQQPLSPILEHIRSLQRNRTKRTQPFQTNTTFNANNMHFRNLLVALVAVHKISCHTVLTNLFVDDVNQGDAVCIRMPPSGPNTTAPVKDMDSNDMACGEFNGSASSCQC